MRMKPLEPVGESQRAPLYLRIALVLVVGALQLSTFYLTYMLYGLIPYSTYIDVSTVWDRMIPYVSWSWTIYYWGFFYITVWGAAGVWRLPRRAFYRSIMVYCALVLVGSILHLLIPTRAPWPEVADLAAAQRAFKTGTNIQPLACLPSMHVAMAVLPAWISLYTFRSGRWRAFSVINSALVTVSIVTAKEHWFLDLVTGLALGLVAGVIWNDRVLDHMNPEISRNVALRPPESRTHETPV